MGDSQKLNEKPARNDRSVPEHFYCRKFCLCGCTVVRVNLSSIARSEKRI